MSLPWENILEEQRKQKDQRTLTRRLCAMSTTMWFWRNVRIVVLVFLNHQDLIQGSSLRIGGGLEAM